jgi:hypothetical protein
MNAVQLHHFRQRQYAAAVARLADEAGRPWSFRADVRKDARLRALGWDDADAFHMAAERLRVRLDAVRKFAADLRLPSAAHARRQLDQLQALAVEIREHHAPRVEVVVLDDDWGRKGRAAKIRAWIAATGATAEQVAGRFQLALSTSRRYVREARRPACKIAA